MTDSNSSRDSESDFLGHRIRHAFIEHAIYDSHEISDKLGLPGRPDTWKSLQGILSRSNNGYCFDFVGLLCHEDDFFCVLPKYYQSAEDATPEEFRNIIRVLRRLDKSSFDLSLRGVEDSEEPAETSSLGLTILILEDYATYGPYRDDERIEQINGPGAIMWQKTIQTAHPVFQEGQPYYLSVRTNTVVTNDNNVFTRLHQYTARACQEQLREWNLQDILELPSIDELDEEIEKIGDPEYVIALLEEELCLQYDSRRRYILELLLAYYKKLQQNDDDTEHGFACFGTTKFEHVWEEVCRATLGDTVHEQPEWKDAMEAHAPHWNLNEPESVGKPYRGKPFMLDMLYQIGDTLHLFDAKYYVPDCSGTNWSGLPGIGDISKQYLYQQILLYTGWKKEKKYSVYNGLLLPTQNNESSTYWGTVHMPFLKELGLGDIHVYQLNPDELYKLYIEGKRTSLHELLKTNKTDMKHSSTPDSTAALWEIYR